jgi:GT2 family glycosyltransferase
MSLRSTHLISAVVVTAGRHNLLKACLDSLNTQAHPFDSIVLVDNSLDAEYSRAIQSRYPAIEIIRNSHNTYYTGALNQGIRATQSTYIVCLNDDIVLDAYFTVHILEVYAKDPCIGMVTGKVLRSDGHIIDSTGLFLSRFLTAHERGYGEYDFGQYSSGYVFGATGAVVAYRRRMLEDIRVNDEYFDEDLRLFYEDLDVAWRAQKKQWKCFYSCDALAFHVRGASVRQVQGIGKSMARSFLTDELYGYYIRNRYTVIAKNISFVQLLQRLPFFLCYEAVSWGYTVMKRLRILPDLINDTILSVKKSCRKRCGRKNSFSDDKKLCHSSKNS